MVVSYNEALFDHFGMIDVSLIRSIDDWYVRLVQNS